MEFGLTVKFDSLPVSVDITKACGGVTNFIR